MSYGLQSHTAKHASIAQADISKDPKTYTEAMQQPDVAEWEVACKDEKQSFKAMGIYKVISCPKGRKVMGSKWVFCIK